MESSWCPMVKCTLQSITLDMMRPTQTFPHELGQAPSTFHRTLGLGPRTLNLRKFPLFAVFCPHLFLHGDQLNLCKEKGLWLIFEDEQKEQVDCFLHHSEPWRKMNPKQK